MIAECGLGQDSVFIDVGAGLGKPNIHVAQVMSLHIAALACMCCDCIRGWMSCLSQLAFAHKPNIHVAQVNIIFLWLGDGWVWGVVGPHCLCVARV